MNEILEKIKSFDPKTYMIFVGIIAALGGIDTFVNAEMWAEKYLEDLEWIYLGNWRLWG